MMRLYSATLAAMFGLSSIVLVTPSVHAWDHPGHMTTAAIAYVEVERPRLPGALPWQDTG